MHEYAVSQGFDSWFNLLINLTSEDRPLALEKHIDSVIDLTQEELLKKVIKESKVLIEGILTEERKTLYTLFDKGVKGIVKRKVSVDKESILNTHLL